MDRTIGRYALPPRIKKKPRERIFEIDFLRGFDIFLMIAVHFCFVISPSAVNAVLVPPPNAPAWTLGLQNFGDTIFSHIDYGSLFTLEFFFSNLFIFLSGISCSFSRSNFKRGIQLAFVSVFLTTFLEVADFLVGVDIHIYVGILQAVSIALLLYALFDHFFPSLYADYLMSIVLAAFTAITLIVGRYAMPDEVNLIFNTPHVNSTGPYGPDVYNIYKLFIGTARCGDDCFSPVTTSCVLFLGVTWGKLFYRNKESLLRFSFPKAWAKPLLFLGRHSLELYILHMPILYIVLFLLLLPAGYRFNI